MLLSEKESHLICQKLLSFLEADDAEVGVSSSSDSHLRFAANAFRTTGHTEDSEASVTVWIEQKKGSASTNELDDGALEAVVRRAEVFARISPEDVEYLPSLGAQTYRPTGGFVEATASPDFVRRDRAIAGVIQFCDQAGAIAAGFHQANGTTGAGATKNGNFHFRRSTLASLSVTAHTREGNGSGYFLRNHFDLSRLDPERIARQALQKALGSRNPRPLAPGVYTVVLEPQAVADLLTWFPYSFDARRAEEGRSPFSAPGGRTKLGERIFDERINLYSDPWHPEVPASPVAQGGLPAQKLYLVRNGVVEALIYSRFWAKKQGKQPTLGPVNTILEGSGKLSTLEEMIRDTRRGLLVSRFWYIRTVDPRTQLETGLTRDGVWAIENGKVSYPVENFRFNQSLLELLAPGNVDLIGAAERVSNSESQGSTAAFLPPLKVKEFHFTSSSEAV